MLSNKLKDKRIEAGLTQEDLAKRVSCTRQTIHSIEHNRYGPSLELAYRIADALGCDINELFHWTNE
jgi:DNA-binding XRE family transcriptional regulator